MHLIDESSEPPDPVGPPCPVPQAGQCILYPSVSVCIWVWVWTAELPFGHTQVIQITIQPFTLKDINFFILKCPAKLPFICFQLKRCENFWTAELQFGCTQVIRLFTLKHKHKRNMRHSKHTAGHQLSMQRIWWTSDTVERLFPSPLHININSVRFGTKRLHSCFYCLRSSFLRLFQCLPINDICCGNSN